MPIPIPETERNKMAEQLMELLNLTGSTLGMFHDTLVKQLEGHSVQHEVIHTALDIAINLYIDHLDDFVQLVCDTYGLSMISVPTFSDN